jgi:hypothetical protein
MTCDTVPLIPSPVQPQETTICVALELRICSRAPGEAGAIQPVEVRSG